MNYTFIQKFFNKLKQKDIKKYTKDNNKIIYTKKNTKPEKKLPLGIKLEIKGKNNSIIINGIIKSPCKLNIKIIGNDNVINIQGDIITPNSLKILITGNENKIEINGPIRFQNSELDIENNKNYFSIQPPARIVKNCYFCLEGLSDVIIGKNCGLNMGIYAIINNNYKQRHKLQIGDGVFIGKDVIIRTSDGHSIIDPETNKAVNEPQDVIIGDNVWIGARNMILKGTTIPNNSIVGAQSVVNKKFNEENIVIAGNPGKIVKRNIKWDVRDYRRYNMETEE